MFESVGPTGSYILAKADREGLPAETRSGAEARSGTEAHGGEHGAKAPFPPFDSATFPGQLLWLAIFFGLLLWLMSKVALPRVQNILEGRAERIAADLAEAKRLKDETDVAIATYEKTLADARAEGNRIAADVHDKVAAEAAEKQATLEHELNARLAASEQQIADARTTALGNVRGIAIDAGAAIVERLAGTAPAADEIEQAVDASLAA